jgi:hypothetical protein
MSDEVAAAFAVTAVVVVRDVAASAAFVVSVSARAVDFSLRWHSVSCTVGALCLAAVEVFGAVDPASWPNLPAAFDTSELAWYCRYSELLDAGTQADPSDAPGC